MGRILVIDDDSDVRTMIEQVLRQTGHSVVQAVDGLEGASRHHREPADLVITDLYMPGQDGIEILTQFRKVAPHVPVIAVSGNSDMLLVAQKSGAVATLKKPFGADELLKAVREALGENR
jgi:DNA-binding NtrC family response regulator